MTRLPYAATTLIGQVQAHRKQAKYTEEGEPDGFNVYRTIAFDKVTSRWLTPLLLEIADPRILSLDTINGRLHVTFIGGPRADRNHEFPLVDASIVLKG